MQSKIDENTDLRISSCAYSGEDAVLSRRHSAVRIDSVLPSLVRFVPGLKMLWYTERSPFGTASGGGSIEIVDSILATFTADALELSSEVAMTLASHRFTGLSCERNWVVKVVERSTNGYRATTTLDSISHSHSVRP
jgi:hypothetical protein